jgi:two-component system response regulator (stage 0 sporulation protein A)
MLSLAVNTELKRRAFKMTNEKAIVERLKMAGIPASLSGYEYLKVAISKVLENPALIHSVTTELYPISAKERNTTSTRLERAIRHAIEVGFERGNHEYLQKLFGYSASAMKGKATNSEFIATVAEDIRLNEKVS